MYVILLALLVVTFLVLFLMARWVWKKHPFAFFISIIILYEVLKKKK
tara:strand:- start:556 stop:696 length:141 start_codon:yes stop_codon:yes gene_type:complete